MFKELVKKNLKKFGTVNTTSYGKLNPNLNRTNRSTTINSVYKDRLYSVSIMT